MEVLNYMQLILHTLPSRSGLRFPVQSEIAIQEGQAMASNPEQIFRQVHR